MNATSMAKLDLVLPETKRRILQLESMLSFDLEVSRGVATWAQQDALWEQGRSEPGIIVTDAKGGYSGHNFGYPVDVFPEDQEGRADWNIDHANWREILEKAPSCGLAEGAQWADFHDDPHLYPEELPATPTDAMREQFKEGGLPEVWRNFAPPLRVE
jgi:peptidoglycan L-alanyl-D-glutamate endopeptidase CwlK